jgi:phosphoserine phosphatase RsbU/P
MERTLKLVTRSIVALLLVFGSQGCVSHPTLEDLVTTQIVVQKDLPDLGKRVLAAEHSLDQIHALLEEYVRSHQGIYGAAFAAPAGAKTGQEELFCPYVYRSRGKLIRVNLNDLKYNYPEQHWFKQAQKTGQAFWTEPYYDEGGGNIWMITYSLPLFENDKFSGVITTDLPVPTK